MRGRNAGFTFLEMLVVLTIIATIAAVALPSFVQVFAYAGQEGAAVRLTDYGRAVMDHAALTGRPLIVVVDREHGRYWCEQESVSEENESNASEMDRGAGEMTKSRQLSSTIDQRYRQRMTQLAGRIEYDQEGILQNVDDLFESEFEIEEAETARERVSSPLLEPVELPDGVRFVSIEQNGVAVEDAIMEIGVGPAGLDNSIRFVLSAGRDSGLEVVWDAVQLRTSFAELIDGESR